MGKGTEKGRKRKAGLLLGMLAGVLLLCHSVPVLAAMTVEFHGYAKYGGIKCGKFTVDGKTAFCMEHQKVTPITGVPVKKSIYKNANVKKVLYYGWKGQEQWSGFKSATQGIVCTSLALSYYYSGKDTVGFKIGSSTDSKIGLSKFLKYLKGKNAPTTSMSFSKSSVTGYASGKLQRTPNLKFTADNRNYVKVKLPDSVKLVKVSGKVSGTTGSVKIYGGATFYLTAPLTLKSTFKTGNLKGSMKEYQSIVFNTSIKGVQKLVQTAVKDSVETAAFTVKWGVPSTDIKITKELLRLNGIKIRAGAGVKFQAVHKETGKKVVFQTDKNGIARTQNKALSAGTWTITEILPPLGYKAAASFSVELVGKNVEKTVVNKEIPRIKVYKRDEENGTLLAGAVFKARHKATQSDIKWKRDDGTTFVEFQTDSSGSATLPYATTKPSGDSRVNVLKAGTYELVEVTPPPGYAARVKEFTIPAGWDGTAPLEVTSKNDTTKVKISKREITGEEELPGAHLKVTDKNGKEIDAWVSAEKPHIIEGLIEGETYILSEVTAPPGYLKSPDIEFTVAAGTDIKEQEVVMYDEKNVVEVEKRAADTGEPLPGCELQIIAADDTNPIYKKGEIVETFITTEENRRKEALPAGKYILHEVSCPEEYELAEDVEFEVTTDTTEVQMVVMVDELKIIPEEEPEEPPKEPPEKPEEPPKEPPEEPEEPPKEPPEKPEEPPKEPPEEPELPPEEPEKPKEPKKPEPPKKEPPEIVKTGDASNIRLLGLLMAGSLAGMTYIMSQMRRRR